MFVCGVGVVCGFFFVFVLVLVVWGVVVCLGGWVGCLFLFWFFCNERLGFKRSL